VKDLYIARSQKVAARSLGGEMMILSAGDSSLFSLNEVGTAIWSAADGRTPLSDIVTRVVCGEFDVTPEVALNDAHSFVQVLAGHGILVVSDEPIAPAAEAAR